ncbi:MAG: sugar phosphate nucleotidyltransferase [Chloroflexota bacterium]
MNFAIIAAGEGSRLQQEGVGIPKPLIKLDNKPLIGRLIESIAEFRPESVSIIVNENFYEVTEYLDSYSSDFPINVIKKCTPSSMHSLFELRNYLRGKPFMLFTVDTIFRRSDLTAYVRYCEKAPEGHNSVAITDYVDDEKPLYVRINDSGDALAFENEPNDNRYITGGIYYFSSDIFPLIQEIIRSGGKNLRLFLRELAASGAPVKAFKFGKMIDVDRIGDIKAAEQFLMEEISV